MQRFYPPCNLITSCEVWIFFKKNNALKFSFFTHGIPDSEDFSVPRGLGLIREVLMIEPGTNCNQGLYNILKKRGHIGPDMIFIVI